MGEQCDRKSTYETVESVSGVDGAVCRVLYLELRRRAAEGLVVLVPSTHREGKGSVGRCC